MNSGQLIRHCPNCGSERPITELLCENNFNGSVCSWPLADVEILDLSVSAKSAASKSQTKVDRRCTSGHSMALGDQICMICGADAVEQEANAATTESVTQVETTVTFDGPTRIGQWELRRRHPDLPADLPFERFDASDSTRQALLTLYRLGSEPDPAVHDVLKRMPLDHIPELIETGRYQGRAYEVTEQIAGGRLGDLPFAGSEAPDRIRRIVDELGRALASFSEVGLRHRDLNPTNIEYRTLDPLDLVITGFGSARLSDFDLEAIAPLELTRYSAPEAIVGAVSAASDWWSLGMILLEQATSGQCFNGVNDRAFRLHVVTRGVDIPEEVEPELKVLLNGLLTRDPLRRWSTSEVRAWLAGDFDLTADAPKVSSGASGPSLGLNGRSYNRPETFALAAAEEANWDQARELVLRGSVTTWLDEQNADTKVIAEVRRISQDESLREDFRHAVSLMALNPSLPLVMRGEIVTPAWLLANPDTAYEVIKGSLTRHLERMQREAWIVRLGARSETVRERAKLLEVQLDEERLRILLLATSRANLEAERESLRQVYPDTPHAGLASIMERSRISDEDLIVLLGASVEQFTPLGQLVSSAEELAGRLQIELKSDDTSSLFTTSRREIFNLVEARIANFARCGVERIDEWADTFRLERRMALPRAAVLLSVPTPQWLEPPKQQYVSTLLSHFEKRVSGAVSRGPLARFSIGKTTPRLDLMELGTGLRPAEAILNHVLTRTEVPVQLDPAGYMAEEGREGRLRRLINHAATFRRDTGLDGRTLGFPFLSKREAKADGSSEARPRLTPVLLWPVVIDFPPGSSVVSMAFDREREEVRLNPALESIIGAQEFQKWRAARDELLGRSAIKVADVLDTFATFVISNARTLGKLPSKDKKVAIGSAELIAAAAIFNAEFTGQSLAEDLRQMTRMPPAGSALEAAIRVSSEPPSSEKTQNRPETENFTVAESDPSQSAAVQQARASVGLLVEGPPGTGKSQTIVNVVSDAVGRGESVLVICQKQAALKVVHKRLAAEKLEERVFMVSDANRDRETILKSLRDQISSVHGGQQSDLTALRRRREDVAARIEKLEAEIDRQHQSIYSPHPRTGLHYRTVVSELIGIDTQKYVNAPGLRGVLVDLSPTELSGLEEEVSAVGNLWLAASYESSPLSVLKPFAADAAVKEVFVRAIAAFHAAEKNREAILSYTDGALEVDDPTPSKEWLSKEGQLLEKMPEAVRQGIAEWLQLFMNGESLPRGLVAINAVKLAKNQLNSLERRDHVETLYGFLVKETDDQLIQLCADAKRTLQKASLFARLNPGRWSARRRTRTALESCGEVDRAPQMEALLKAAQLELDLRPIRRSMEAVRRLFGSEGYQTAPAIDDLKHDVSEILDVLIPVSVASEAVQNCPFKAEAVAAGLSGQEASFKNLFERMKGALVRFEARVTSRQSIEPLEAWIEPGTTENCINQIYNNRSNTLLLDGLISRLETLEAYQRFRTRTTHLAPVTLKALSILREREVDLRGFEGTKLSHVMRATVRREGCLAWKGEMETSNPDLLIEHDEISRKVLLLASLDDEMRDLNRSLLRRDIDPGKIGSANAWDDITRLRGPRARRLREILDQGKDIGLMHLRPVWLMNPDVASRILPLKKALFDLVIFDEASQMPVEHAVPSLFRSSRAFVAGDEKQMPPSNFFSGRLEDDDEDIADIESFDDGATEAERAAQEDKWNRREVKDCPDLLQLARGVFPSAMLQIHYRSRYRELIGYSNSAFYKGELSVPARHPDNEVRRARPIEVLRVDGVYEDQTNEGEASAVVTWLSDLWSRDAQPPSVGIVTFNRKQADLIEELVEKRAEEDSAFLRSFSRERDRVQSGEDMGFFVKNVENVQGDERDIIVFSTTFGRDKHGTFRRFFGVLGQTGGERRLNVAVTRAREKVVLVTSMPIGDVSDWATSGRMPNKPRDYLQAYLQYAERMSSGDLEGARGVSVRSGGRMSGQKPARSVSDDSFKASVAEFVRELGYEPVASSEDDAFGMDFAIEDRRTGLFGFGIECDAPRHPLLSKARAREIWRPRVLSKAIPVVHRVSSTAWYHRPTHERERLRTSLRSALG